MFITNNLEYRKFINNYITSKPPSEENISELVKTFLSRITCEGSKQFNQKSATAFKTLSTTVPGRELMERIIRTGKTLTIIEEDTNAHSNDSSIFYQPGCQSLPALNKIFFNFNYEHYHITLNSEGEKMLFKSPIEVALAHEFIHCIHHAEGVRRKKMTVKSGSSSTIIVCVAQDIINEELDNEEEQLTITGFSKIDPEEDFPVKIQGGNKGNAKNSFFAVKDPLCENSFLAAFARPFRINHKGTESLAIPGLTDIIVQGALGSLKEAIKENQKKIHEHQIQVGLPKMSPLSLAAYHGKRRCLNFLLSEGADIRENDEIGGVLIAAIRGGFENNQMDNWELAHFLLDRGADVHLKDKEGITALDHFLVKNPTSKFCKNKRPLVKRLKSLTKG